MKLNFFSRIYLAITDFRLYPFIAQKEKFISAFAYFLAFMILISAIMATGVTTRILGWTNEFLTVYDSTVKDFTITDGILDVSENMNFEFAGVKLYTDDTTSYKDFKVAELNQEEDQLTIIALKDSFAIGNLNVGFLLLEYSNFNIETNKQDIYKILDFSLDSPVFKLSLAGAVLCSVFMAYTLTKFLNVVGITVMLLFLGMVFRTDYKFKDYMKVAFYVITLPIITEVIALTVTGELNEYATITYYLLVYVYMYYAIRALKLDNIIMSTQEKILGMKINLGNDLSEDLKKKQSEESQTNIEEENKSSSNEEKNDDNDKSE